LLFFLSKITDANTFNWVLLVYSLLYAPTLALTNSIAFDQLQNPKTSLAGIRVFGTMGWIIAGVSIDKVFGLSATQMSFTFLMASAASVSLSLLSVLLPPAIRKTETAVPSTGISLFQNAFDLFKNRSFTVFFVASILVCIPLAFYYSLANQFFNEKSFEDATSKMAFGQVSEALFILLIPFFLSRWGIKKMIMVGIIAWALRFLLFRRGDGGDNSWMLIAGILLHGVCYDFFFVTGQMYTDSIANDDNRNAAQGLITMATYGVGMWIGSLLSGYVAQQATITNGSHQWETVWMVPVAISIAVLIFFSLFFKENKSLKVSQALST